MSALGPHNQRLLRIFGAHIEQGFGHTPYHVGSSLTSKERYRDVDVRLILPDDEWVAFFGDWTAAGWDAPRLKVWEFAWSLFGRDFTRLPVDFQIQAQTVANGNHAGPRSALIVTTEDLPVVRVAYPGGVMR